MFGRRFGQVLYRSFSSRDAHLLKVDAPKQPDGVKRITLANPKGGNCLSIPMMKELSNEIEADWDNKELRVIVIGAEGKIFSAGHDLKELTAEAGKQRQTEVFETATRLMRAIICCPVPVIAAVDGYAVAAGCQLVAQCDLAVCTEKSKFSTPGANVGIFCSTPGVALARAVPKATALKMLFTGNAITADEALRTGLISHVAAKDELEATVDCLCESIVSKSRAVIEIGKRFYYKQINDDVMSAYANAGRVMVENLDLPDGAEGVRSFVNKTKPKWTH